MPVTKSEFPTKVERSIVRSTPEEKLQRIGEIKNLLKKAEQLMKTYSGLGRGPRLVWEVLERSKLVNLDFVKKIMCLRSMVKNHVFRLRLASKIKQSQRSGTQDQIIPSDSDESDLQTKWMGSEAEALIQHCDILVMN